MYLVYLRAPRHRIKNPSGITAQLWPEILKNMDGTERPCLQKILIPPGHRDFILEHLVKLYPCTVKPEN
jgi:hypothetical protein